MIKDVTFITMPTLIILYEITRSFLLVIYNKLTDKWNKLGRLRQVLGYGQHEDRESEEHRDAQGDLLARVRGQTEHQQRQGRHHHTREHNVVHVIQRSSPDLGEFYSKGVND